MTEDRIIKLRKTRRVFMLLSLLGLVLTALCFLLPHMRQEDTLGELGEKKLSELRAFSTAVSHYSSDQIESLRQKPETSADYKDMAALLADIRSQNDYHGVYLLIRDDKKKDIVLIDAAYRDNAEAGNDYYAPGAEYPVKTYAGSASLIETLYSGKSTGVYSTRITTLPGMVRVCTSYLPVYGDGTAVSAVLAVDSDIGDVDFGTLGPVDLRKVGAVLAVVTAVCMLAVWLLHRRLQPGQAASRGEDSGSVPDEETVTPQAESPESVSDDSGEGTL